jgi:hypothetical protein
MINLLPNSLIHQNLTEYRRRLLGLGLIWLSVVILTLIAIELFYLESVRIKSAGLDTFPARLEPDDFKRRQAATRSIQDLKHKLKIVAPVAKADEPSVQLASLLSLRPAGIKLTAIQYARSATGKRTITLAGVAENREVLLNFIARLETWPDLVAVRSPLDNLIRGRDLAFSINLELK